MALPSIDEARAWLNQQLGGGYDASGQFQPGSVFNNGVYDTSNTLRNDQVLGKGQQMGLSPAYEAQILGIPVDQITQFQQSNQPNIDSYAQVFQHDATSPAPYMVQGNGATPQSATTPGGVAGAYSGGYGMGTQSSPWLDAMASELGRRTNLGLSDAFNQIRSDSVGVGGLGGDRQGIAQGVAARGAMDSLQGQLANLYGTDWTNAQNRGLQQYGMDQNYALGQGGLANQKYGMDQNFYTAQRGQDLNSLGLGANIYDIANKDGWTGLLNANNIFNTSAGNNTTTTGGTNAGGGWQGILGGALAGGALAGQAGWWK
jgi:hypothetical protein